MDKILLGVPLQLQGKPLSTTEGGDGEIVPDKGDLSAIVKEVNATCHKYQREAVWRTVCQVHDVVWFLSVVLTFSIQIAAQSFVQQKECGLAISYCVSAEDWPRLGNVVDCVLQEYVHAGELSTHSQCHNLKLNGNSRSRAVHKVCIQYCPIAAGIACKLCGTWCLHLLIDVCCVEHGVHQRLFDWGLQDAAWDLISMFQEDMALKSWWVVLLCNAVELLQYGVLLVVLVSGVAKSYIPWESTLLFLYRSVCLLLQQLDTLSWGTLGPPKAATACLPHFGKILCQMYHDRDRRCPNSSKEGHGNSMKLLYFTSPDEFAF